MPVYRVVFGFAGANTGWTETHACRSDVGSAILLQPIMQGIAQERVKMLGFPFACNGIRISAYSDGAVPAARVPRNVNLSKNVYSNAKFDATTGVSLPAVVALQASGFADNLSAPVAFRGNENTTFLGAPPVECLTFAGGGGGAGNVNPARLLLGQSFNSWKQAMINQVAPMGWLASNKTANPPQVITGITQTTNGNIQFVVAGAPVGDGTLWDIRVSGVNGGRSPCNGPFTAIFNAEEQAFITKEQVAFATAQRGGQLVIYYRTNVFVPYGNIVLQGQTIKHKRGRPFLSEPGRAKKRVRA